MDRIRRATAGLFVAWTLHDLEEFATMSDNSRALASRLPDRVPVLAGSLMVGHLIATSSMTSIEPDEGAHAFSAPTDASDRRRGHRRR